MSSTPLDLEATISRLRDNGYIVLTSKAYYQAQERQRQHDVMRQTAEDQVRGSRVWAEGCLNEERRLRDRLSFVYGVAKAHGATDEALRGCEQCLGGRQSTSGVRSAQAKVAAVRALADKERGNKRSDWPAGVVFVDELDAILDGVAGPPAAEETQT